MSILLPIVFFHTLPARAIRRSRTWFSFCSRDVEVMFAALSIEGVGPEKKAKMLYSSS